MAVDRLSLTFGALADPTRRAILARLAKGGASVTEIAKPFDMSLPAVSKHLKVLERAGLVTRGKEAQWRPAALEAGPPQKIDDWGAGSPRLWGQRAPRSDEGPEEKGREEGRPGPAGASRRRPTAGSAIPGKLRSSRSSRSAPKVGARA